jgi:phospholipid/cholesterol/gamma-HCH transport system substrate-binding protein
MQNAVRVGGLVVVFGALIVGAYAVLGKSLFAPPTVRYYAEFDDVAGMQAGTRILLAGVKVGQVEEIRLVSATRAKATLALDPEIKIPRGTVAVVPTPLIGLGDSALELQPPAVETTAFFAANDTLPGRKAGALDDLLPDAKTTFAELNATLVATRKLLEDQSLQRDARKLIATSTTTIASFGKLAGDMDRLLTRNERSISVALTRGTAAISDVQKITGKVVAMLDEGSLQRDTKAILRELLATSKKADALVGNMNALVADANIKTSMRNVADITDEGKKAAKNVTEMTETGKGIATNTEAITKNGVKITENVIDLTERTKLVLDGAVEIENRLKGLLDKVDRVIPSGKGSTLPTVVSSMDLIRETEPGRYRTDVNARFQLKNGTLDVGVWDAFESNRLTIQYGVPVNQSLSYRYGIFASKVSAGVDYQLTPRLFLRNDFWDLNDPRYDARLRYELGNGLYGWLGMERVFRSNSPVFGIGIRR